MSLLACSERALTVTGGLEVHFPSLAERVLAPLEGHELRLAGGPAMRGAAGLVLPATADAPARFTLGGLSLEVRERGLEGEAQRVRGAVVYARQGGRSYWSATRDGYEEWVERFDADDGPVAEWDVTGASLQQLGDDVMVVDASGLGRVRISAPAALGADGAPGRAWLRASGQRLALYTDLRGHVLVDPSWAGTTSLSFPTSEATVTLLQDGTLFVYGGENGPSLVDSAARYDPLTGTWAPSASGIARKWHTATLLKNGQVLVVGGFDGAVNLASAQLYDPTSDAWSNTGSLPSARRLHTATLLSNGRVLIAGGADMAGAFVSAELYDPATRQFTATGSLNQARSQHRAVRLQDGSVLAISGLDGSTERTSSERYNVTTGTWTTSSGALATGRAQFSATALLNGEVLVAGGLSSGIQGSAERFNPATNTWSPTGSLATARYGHTATLMPNGRVLVAGGQAALGNRLNSAELYDPAVGAWESAGTMARPHAFASAGLLPNGKALIIGGLTDGGTFPYTPITELWDPTDGGTLSATGSLITPRSEGAAVTLHDGRVLAIGGVNATGAALASAELYSPGTGTWAATGPMSIARRQFAAVLLSNGKVLVAGGNNGTAAVASSELYDPATGTWSLTGSMVTARQELTATTRQDGTVFVAGGISGTTMVSTGEIYAPHTGTWTATASNPSVLQRRRHTATLIPNTDAVLLAGGFNSSGTTAIGGFALCESAGGCSAASSPSTLRALHTATRLPNGKVLIAAGLNGTTVTGALHAFNPATSMTTAVGAVPSGTPVIMNPPRAEAAAAVLPNGKVLIAGGYQTVGTPLASTTLFDPGRGAFISGPNLSSARVGPMLAVLPNGKVLIAGGATTTGSTAACELYDEGREAPAASVPTITPALLTQVPNLSMTFSGTRFEGVSEGGRGGTDGFSGAYPLVQLRSAENEQRYRLPTTGFSATSVTTTPLTFPPGLYWVSVTVGGVPSAERPLELFTPLTIAPANPTYPPRAPLQTFTAGGGSGVYRFTLDANPSGGSITATGSYSAGGDGGVVDVVRLTDQQGRSVTTNITVGPGVTTSPATVTRAPRQPQTFTASGGSGTGFTWAMVTPNSGGTINAAGSYTAGTTGGVADTVRVTDSLGNTADATVNVSAGVSLTPTSPTVPPRGTRTFAAAGGSGTGFTWSMAASPSGGSVNAAGLYTAGAVGNVTDTVRVTDSLGNIATVNVAVTPGVSLTPSSATRPPLATQPFTAMGGSGSGFTFSLAGTSGGSITAGGLYTAGAVTGNDTVTVTDSLGNTATAAVTVSSGVGITPSGDMVPPRAMRTFTAGGGSGAGYTWQLTANPSGGTINATSGQYVAGPVGGTTDVIRLTDSLGNTATAMVVVTAGVSVAPTSPSLSPRASTTFTASGGSNAGMTWSLLTNASGGSIGASTGVYTAGSVGSVTDVVQATDSLGNTATASVSVTAAISITPATLTLAPSATQDFDATGGVGSGYSWSVTSVPANGTINSNTGEYRAGATGGVMDQVRVVDTLGNEATATVMIAGGLVITPQDISVAPLGRASFMAVGGTGAGYRWSFQTNASGGAIDPATGAYVAGDVGGVVDTVLVRDSLMNSATTNVTVTARLDLQPRTSNVAPRGSVAFVATGGASPRTFSLSINGSGGSIDPDTGAYVAGATPGVTDEVTVTDANGATATATLRLTGEVKIVPDTVTLAPGGAQAFTATGGSGTGFTWSIDTNVSGGTIDPATGSYVAGETPGNDVVLVTDSLQNTALATVSVVASVERPFIPYAQRGPVSGWSCGCGATPGDASLASLLGLAVLALRRRPRARGARSTGPTLAVLAAAVAVLAAPALAAPAKKKPAKPAKTAPAAPVAPPPAPVPTPPAPVATPAPAEPEARKPTKRSVAVLDVSVTVPNEKLDEAAFTDMAVNSLSGSNQFTVISARDVRTILGIERQKQLLGCEESGCMAELANAMGSDFVLQASIGKVGDTYLVSVNLVDGAKSRIVGRSTLQTQQANALLGAVWRATQQAIDAYGASLSAPEAQQWSARPKQEPPAAIAAEVSVPNYFGVTLLAVGGLQVLSDPGNRGSIGAEVALTFRRGRLDLGAGVIIGPHIGARITASWALIDSRFRLSVGLRGTGYPGLLLFGGGLGVTTEFALTPWLGLIASGAGEVYPAPSLPVVAVLGSLGVTARF